MTQRLKDSKVKEGVEDKVKVKEGVKVNNKKLLKLKIQSTNKVGVEVERS
jgi:hypothetical protein